MAEQRYEMLCPESFGQLLDQAPIAYLPWGAHEWHGTHNCLGVDSLKAAGICSAIAERTGGIVFPPVYCGHGTVQRWGHPHTLEFPIELVEQLARHYFLQLRIAGFRVIVAVLGHYGRDHVCAIQRMARLAEEGFREQLRIIALPDHAWTSPQWPGDHGGANETSYMLHMVGQTVHLSQLPSASERPTLSIAVDGVGGADPRSEASVDRGRRQLELLLTRATEQILGTLAETNFK